MRLDLDKQSAQSGTTHAQSWRVLSRSSLAAKGAHFRARRPTTGNIFFRLSRK